MAARATSLTATGTGNLVTSFTGGFQRFIAGAVTTSSLVASTVVRLYMRLGGAVNSSTITTLGLPWPIAAHGDWPDYSIVPQMDHYWNLAGDYVDVPGPGKTEYDLTTDAAGLTWQNDWAGRTNQAVQMDGTHQLYTVNHPDLCDLGSTWALFAEFQAPANFNAANPSILYSVSGAPLNGYRLYVSTATGILIFRTYNAGSVYEDNGYALTASAEYLVVYVMTGGNIYGYVNGVLFETKALTAPGTNATNWFSLPYIDATFQYYRVGVLKGTALTGTQVGNLYNTWVDCGVGTYARHPDSPVTTTALGGITINKLLSGIVTCATSISAAVTTAAGVIIDYISGAITCGTALVGRLSLAMLLTGVIRCSTTMIARTVRLWTVAGTIVTSTRVAARVSLKMFLGATIACSTSVFTNLVTIGTKLISGIIACSTMLSMGNIGGLVTSIGRHIIKSATFQYSKAMERLHIKM